MVIPKKRFGQHFLKDPNIIRKIIDGAEVSSDDVILEIGPGLGDMTSLLAKKAGKVIAVEVDRELFAELQEKFTPPQSPLYQGGDKRGVELINADALRFDIKALSERIGSKLKVVANLPYNISTPLLFKFFEARDCISSMTLMFQKEVADRLAAVPGTKDYGVLSVHAQLYTKPMFLFKVAPGAFSPPPKVDSAVVKLDVLSEPLVKAKDEGVMLKVVKAAFGQRRKTLSNALSSVFPKDAVAEALNRSGIDGKRRGETLALAEFCKLSDNLQVSHPHPKPSL